MRVWIACASLLLAAALAPAAAFALAPGVHIDPGSPAAKEYALPLAQARGDTSAGKGSSSGSPVALFGQGVTRPKAGGPASRAQTALIVPGSVVVGGAAPDAVSLAFGPAASSSLPGHASSAAAGGDSAIVLGGGALAVLVVGGAAGLALRRRAGRAS